MQPSDEQRRPFVFETLLCWLMAGATAVLAGVRAWSQSVTHDEALTWTLFINGSWRRPLAYAGNQNHVLFDVLAKGTTSLFGPSEFALRLPTLAAAAVYCVSVVLVVRRLTRDAWLRVLGVAMLLVNPYTLDFLIAARGYGLMLAGVLAALVVLPFTEDRPVTDHEALIAGFWLALALAATVASVVPVAGIGVAAVVVELRAGRWRRLPRLLVLGGLPLAALALPLLLNQLIHARAGDYYMGADSLRVAALTLARAGWTHQNPYPDSGPAYGITEQVVAAGGAAVIVMTVAFGFRRRSQALLWLAAMLGSMSAAAIALHVSVGALYPQGRTGLYWLPLVTLAALALAASASTQIVKAGAASLFAIVVLNSLAHLQVSTFVDWPYDASTRHIVERIDADHGGRTTEATIGGSWQLEPSLNFYRTTKRLGWLRPIERRTPQSGDDYYVLRREDASVVAALGLEEMYVDRESGTILAVPAR